MGGVSLWGLLEAISGRFSTLSTRDWSHIGLMLYHGLALCRVKVREVLLSAELCFPELHRFNAVKND
jgi:hypothetical protein